MQTIYNGRQYAIYHIEEDDEDCEQYKIFIKETCKAKKPNAQIDRDCYSQIENGIEYAHEMARDTIREHFVLPQK